MKHRKSKHKSKHKKSKHHKALPPAKHAWWPWALGLGGVGLVAYLLWPKTALAATPPKIIPGPGNIQISAGSKVPLIATLLGHGTVLANSGIGDNVNVPAGTVITIDQLDANGTIWFRYNGNKLTSPVEEYSDKVGMPIA